VGKTTNLKTRIRNHIKPNTVNIWGDGSIINFHKKTNTVSQLRIGLERIFNKQSLELIKNNVSVSYICLAGDENAINRFYGEDKLISEFFPLLNIDIER